MVSDSVAFIDDLDHLNDLADRVMARVDTDTAINILTYGCVYEQLCAWFGEPA